jgi:beta-phosphoglucomutase
MQKEANKLVIFDMDGVLVDACEWHRIALNEALKQVCDYEIPLEEHYKIFNGIPTKIKLQILSDRGIINKKYFDEVEQIKQKKTLEAIEKYAFLRKEKVDLMHFLKKNNIKIACYTNSIKITAEKMLKKTGILEYLDLLVTNQDVIKPKPDPEGYIFCFKKLNIDKINTYIVEDSEKGIQAAISSGCNLIKVKNQDEVTLELLRNII